MNQNTVRLSQMLALLDRQLDQASASQLRDQIAGDAELMKRWQRVQARWGRLQLCEQRMANSVCHGPRYEDLHLISRRTEMRDLRRTEAIAAFVEGRLDQANSSRIESLCWSNPAWLAEVVSSYFDTSRKEFFEIDKVGLEYDRLFRRLSTSLPVRSQVTQSPSQGVASPDDVVLIELSRANVRASALRGRIGFGYWSAAAALLLLGFFLLTRLNQSQTTVVAEPHRATSGGINQANVVADDSKASQLAPGAVESIQPQIAVISPTAEVREPSNNSVVAGEAPMEPVEFAVIDWNKILNDAAEATESHVPASDPVATQHNAPQVAKLAVPLEWREMKGIVATRDVADRPWQGLDTNLPSVQRFEFATLPASWARADIEGFGSLTLFENSQVRVWRAAESPNQLHLATVRGQLAVDDLSAGVNFEIAVGPAVWHVAARSDNTTVAVDCDGESPRLQVVSGELLVNDDLTLRRGDETTWMLNGSLVATRANARPDWIEAPPAAIRSLTKGINRKLLERFAVATDIISELKSAAFDAEIAAVQDRSVFARILMKFEPQEFAIEVLESADAGLSRDTLTWLFSQDRRQPTIRPIWIALARSTKEPNKIRTLFNWIDMANQRERVPLETASAMIEWLTDDHLLFRQSGQMFLELAFGSIVEYDPHWPPLRCEASANQWRSAIAEFYRLRQRRDAATGRNR